MALLCGEKTIWIAKSNSFKEVINWLLLFKLFYLFQTGSLPLNHMSKYVKIMIVIAFLKKDEKKVQSLPKTL